MAITYNPYDNVFYGTNTERLADDKVITKPTAKFYEYDTGNLYITDGVEWRLM